MYNLSNIKGNGEYSITLDMIREKVDDYQIFAFYIGYDFKLGESIKSPLRRDDNPSFSVFRSGYAGKLLYKDFSTGESGDVISFLEKLLNLNFGEVLKTINRDLSLGLECGPIGSARNVGFISNINMKTVKTAERVGCKIGINIKPYSKSELEYWGKYGIDEACLKRYNVFSVKNLYINDTLVCTSKQSDPIFSYVFQKDNKLTYKVYKPLSIKRYKWTSNTDKSVLQGWDQIPATGKVLIITKSLKDVMTLSQMGYAALSMQTEVSSVKPSVVEELKERFDKIYILQDFDYAGVKGANHLKKQFGFKVFFIQSFKTRSNGLKDISDYVEAKGVEAGAQLIKSSILKLNER